MAITEYASGSETVGTTEWSCTTDTAGPDVQTDDGLYQLVLDLNALALGDVFEAALYEKVLSAGTQRAAWRAQIANAQHCPLWISPAFMLLHGWDFTVKKLAGTDRAIDFSVRRVSSAGIAEHASGTETVGATEWSMTTDTAGPDADAGDAVVQIFADFNALVTADSFEVKLYEKALSAGTQRRSLIHPIRLAQNTPIWVSPSFIALHGWDATLIKLAGTDRAIDFSVRKVG